MRVERYPRLLNTQLKSPQIKSGITIQTYKQISRNRSIGPFKHLGRNRKQALFFIVIDVDTGHNGQLSLQFFEFDFFPFSDENLKHLSCE